MSLAGRQVRLSGYRGCEEVPNGPYEEDQCRGESARSREHIYDVIKSMSIAHSAHLHTPHVTKAEAMQKHTSRIERQICNGGE